MNQSSSVIQALLQSPVLLKSFADNPEPLARLVGLGEAEVQGLKQLSRLASDLWKNANRTETGVTACGGVRHSQAPASTFRPECGSDAKVLATVGIVSLLAVMGSVAAVGTVSLVAVSAQKKDNDA